MGRKESNQTNKQNNAALDQQGLHRHEKYLNIQDCLEKSLKIKLALKVLEKHSKAMKSP